MSQGSRSDLVKRLRAAGEEAMGTGYGYLLVAAADALHAAASENTRQEPKLDKPAQVGNTRFGVGVKERLVVERAQREYVYQSDPKIDAERLQKVKAFVDACQHPELGVCPKCGTYCFEAPCPYQHSSPLNCPMKGDAGGPQ